MERRRAYRVCLLLFSIGVVNHAQAQGVPVAVPTITLAPIPTSTTAGRLPIQPGNFTACWGTTILNSITWNVQTTTFTNITVVPHITPYANGTNITSYESIMPQGPAPTAILSTTMFNGSVCVAPTPCIEQLTEGCDSHAERRLFRRLDSTGSAGTSAPEFTNPETYVTATSILERAYTAPPKIEPRVDPTSAPPEPSTTEPAPAPAPNSPGNGPTSKKPQPQPTRNLVPQPAPDPSDNDIPQSGPSPTQGQGNPRPGSDTGRPPTVPDLPDGFSMLPSAPGVVLPGGQTLQPSSVTIVDEVIISLAPGSSTTLTGVQVSLAPSGNFIAIGSSQTIALPPALTPAAPELPSGVVVLPLGVGLALPEGQTLGPGSATTVNGIPISLSPSGNVVVVDGSKTIDLAPAPAATELPNGFSALPSGSGLALPNGQSLKPGSATIVNGVSISLSPSESVVVVDGSRTIDFASTPTGDNAVLPNGETLKPGVLTTILGVPVSLSPGETKVVIDGSTITVKPEATGYLESLIWSGISAKATTTKASKGSHTSSTSADSSSAEATPSASSGDESAPPAPSPSDGGAVGKVIGQGTVFAVIVGFVQLWLSL